jgi:MFS family permease
MSFTLAPVQPPSRWRDVHIAAVARGASIGGDMLTATALLLALQSRGAGGVAVAAVLIAASAPLVLLAPLSGRLVDRVDSRVLLTVVGAGQAAACSAMVFAQATPVLVGLVALIAAGTSVTQPAFSALLPEMVRRDDLPRATALLQTASSAGMLAGPPLAGLLVGAYGLRIPLLLDAATFAGIAVAGLLIATRRRPAPRPADGAVAAAGVAWTIRGDRLLLPLVVTAGLVIAVVSAINVVDVFFVRETLGASATMYGVVGGVWTGAMIIGSWLVARRPADDSGYALVMAASLGACCAVIALAGLVPHVGWLIPLFLVGGVGNGAINSTAGVLISRRAPAQVRGRAFGYFSAVASAANIGGFAAGGVLVGQFAPGTLLVGCGARGGAVVAACAPPVLRAARRERARAATVRTDSAAAAEPASTPAAAATA